jgi:MFS family permease
MSQSVASIWRDGTFLRLWSASTISYFGSFITRTALPFAAILVLGAGPLDISALRSLELVAGLLVALIAGAWVDRLRRRPIMIGADVGRAVILASIPVAAVAGALGMPQLLAVAFVAAILTTFFDVASRTYLPSVVSRTHILGANSALTASSSVAEFAGFGLSGFLIQLFTAPVAIAADAASFVVSALLLGSIRRSEPPRPAAADREPVLTEIRAGLRVVLGSPVLRAIAGAHGATHILWGFFSTSYLLFATHDLGLGPAALGLIAAVGGAASFVGAAVVGRVVRRIGIGPTFLVGLTGFTLGSALIPLAPEGAVLVAAGLLVGQQVIADLGGTMYDIVEVSLTQSIVDSRILGRVNATIHTYTTLIQLGGTIGGGIFAAVFGLRTGIAIGLLGGVAAIAFIWFSPIRTMRVSPGPLVIAPLTTEETPLTE